MSTNVLNPADMLPFESAALPAYLRDTAATSTLSAQQVGSNIDRITQVDGGVVIEEAGVKSQPMLSIDVVILDAHPVGRDTYRAYYEGVYKEGEATAPACFSSDGKIPSPTSEKPQCATCAQCPKNIKGSGINGDGKACGYFKHLAVATYPDMNKIYRLKVSSRSIFNSAPEGVPSPLGGKAWGFTDFAKNLQRTETPWEAVVTRVSLPKGQTYGFFFTPVGYLTEEQFNHIRTKQTDPQMQDVLSLELAGAPVAHAGTIGFLPPPPPPAALTVQGRAKWLSDQSLPQEVRNWIAQVDDTTAQQYLQTNYPNNL